MFFEKISDEWKKSIEDGLKEILSCVDFPAITRTVPPKSELGDIAFPLFPYSRIARKAPDKIGEDLLSYFSSHEHPEGEMNVTGGYFNVKIDVRSFFAPLFAFVKEKGDEYGKNESMKDKKIMLEFSCPNTNKPLHLGHMRNDSLGEAVSAILKANGADVMKVNLINNRGIHISKSMLSYKEFGNGETPESTGEKGDHFVGRYYVLFANWEKQVNKEIDELRKDGREEEAKALEENHPDKRAQEMLRLWENGDKETLELWKKMNDWTISGLMESYEDTGISFDRIYYESDTYKLGKSEVLKGLEEGIFEREEDGSVQIDLKEINLDKKVLLRKDGTTIYITQDLGTAIKRHEDWAFDSLIYVVASEQAYHFKVLFYILKKLGYPWADGLRHLSYGMVNLPEGKMKSREGTVVDADDLVHELSELAKKEIYDKERENVLENVEETAHSIAISALNYYLLSVSPSKDMIFDPKKSISFSGNTGPYLEYMSARISSILRKAGERKEGFDPHLLTVEDEKTLIKLIDSYPSVVKEAGENLDPSLIASFLYDMAKTFSHYYHDNTVLGKDKDLMNARLCLSEAVLITMKNAFSLLKIPYLEAM